jgi:flagellar biosynthesis/type III secretory pathway protein FliH
VLLAVHLALKQGKHSLTSLELKMQIVRHLFAKGFTQEKRDAVYLFIRHFIRLSDTDETIFVDEIQKLEEIKDAMSILEVSMMIQHNNGVEKGKLEGLQEGELKGKLKGLQEGKLKQSIAVIKNGLEKGLSISLISDLVGLSEAKVRNIIEEHQLNG